MDDLLNYCPDNSQGFLDTAFIGVYKDYSDRKILFVVPTKKPKGGELTDIQKSVNTLISSTRVPVEHVIAHIKTLHILKHTFRARVVKADKPFKVGCKLYNFRKRFP